MKFKDIKSGTIFSSDSIIYIRIHAIYTDYGILNAVRILDGTTHFFGPNRIIELSEANIKKPNSNPNITRYSYYVEK